MGGEFVTAIIVSFLAYYLHSQARKSWAQNVVNRTRDLLDRMGTHSTRMSIIYRAQLDELQETGDISEETLMDFVEGWKTFGVDIEELSKVFQNLTAEMGA